MAFCGISSPAPTPLQLLLDEIKFQQQKELQFATISDAGGFLTRGTTYWTDVFVRHFLFQMDRSIDADDLLFFIRKKHVRTTLTMPKFQTDVEVFRKDSKKLPIGDPEIEWKETVFLNLLIHQLEYTLTLAICTRTSPKDLQVLKRHSQKVYASPSRRRMDTKGEVEEITYPFLSFMVDNFDEVYSEMTVRDGEMVCVELLAQDRDHGFQAVLFLGSIRYDALKRVYDSRASLGSKMAQRMTFGFFSGSHSQRVEYVRLRGPHGKGHAEVAVSKPKGAGVETPTSEPGFCMTDGMWDSDAESDTEDFVFKHHRRLSDPSSNLNAYSRSGWRSMKGIAGGGGGGPGGGGGGGGGPCSSGGAVEPPSSVGIVGAAKRTRSQNEGLDYCGLAEIEAGDVRDDEHGRRRGRKESEEKLREGGDKEEEDGGRGRKKEVFKMEEAMEEDEDDEEVLWCSGCTGRRKGVCCSQCTKRGDGDKHDDKADDDDNTVETETLSGLPHNNGTGSGEPDSCCPCPCPFPRSQSLAFENIPMTAIDATSGTSGDKNERLANQLLLLTRGQLGTQLQQRRGFVRRHPLIPSKTIVVPPTSSSSLENLVKLENKATSIACLNDARIICREKVLASVPNKMSSTGVRILYLCDVMAGDNEKTELDDGAYNPLWTMRGFTQSFHIWKENRRAQSVPLNAFLTYITLPCASIMKDILDIREEPVLTF